MQLYSYWKSVLQTFMKTSNAGLFSNQPDYFKYCWAIFHKRASVSTFLILQQSPQFIFEQLCKNPPCPSSEFPSYERYTAYSYFDKIDSYFDKIDFTYFSFRYLAVIPSRDDFLSILGYPLCPSISLLGHIFHQIIFRTLKVGKSPSAEKTEIFRPTEISGRNFGRIF